MNKYTFNHKGFTFERVSKEKARTAYKNGLSVLVCACNMHPFNVWGAATVWNRKNREQFVVDEIGVNNDFTALVNSFEYYNCTTRQAGRYAAFYIPVRDVDRFTGEEPTPATMGTVREYDYRFMQA